MAQETQAGLEETQQWLAKLRGTPITTKPFRQSYIDPNMVIQNPSDEQDRRKEAPTKPRQTEEQGQHRQTRSRELLQTPTILPDIKHRGEPH